MSGKCYFLLFELKLLHFNDFINWLTAQINPYRVRCLLLRLRGSVEKLHSQNWSCEGTEWTLNFSIAITDCVIQLNHCFRPAITDWVHSGYQDKDAVPDNCNCSHRAGWFQFCWPGARTEHRQECRGSRCSELVHDLSRKVRGREAGQNER